MKFDDLISTIDQLDDEQIDEVVDWQMSQSPAACKELGRPALHSGIRPEHFAYDVPGNFRYHGFGTLTQAATENPLQRMTDSIQRMLDCLLVLTPDLSIDIATWFPPEMLVDRCTQCQRYLPASRRPDPELSRPGVLSPHSSCDECAGMQH